jgi:undecaprenyl-diphosphatase
MARRFTPGHVMRWLRALTLRTVALFAVAIVASVAFVVLAAQVRTGALDRLDVSIELVVHRLDAPPLDVVMMTATLIGSNVVLLPAVAAVALLAVRARRRRIAVVLIADTIAVIAIDALLKVMFSRARPRLFEKIALPHDYSFPSGHSMSAIGIYGVIAAALIALYPARRGRLVVAAAVLIAVIGLSRIYLGVHWPFDVLGGLLGGIPPLVISVHLLHRERAPDRNVADLVEATDT